MAESNLKGMISGMDSLLTISGEEFLEVIRLEANGSYKNYRLLVSKIRNNAGLSAYEIAVQNGFVGSVEAWLKSLEGKSAYQVAVELGFIGDTSVWLESLVGVAGEDGAVGKSIYDIAKEGGFVGTEADFLKTLVGKSAYQSALDTGFIGTEAEFVVSLKGEKGDTGSDGEIGPDGKSAFQVWQDLPGNTGKPVEEFLESQKGNTGDSAYESALALDPTVGTETEWLVSLEGKSAYEVAKAADPTVGTETEWLKTLVGDNAYQVAVDKGFVGDEAAWLESLKGQSAYQLWIVKGNVGTEDQFLESLEGTDGANGTDGIDGAAGESTYATWLKLPGNEGKTEAEFIASIKGEKGEDGTNGIDGLAGEDGVNGESAYQVWLALPDNAGKTEAEFIDSLKGVDGIDGKSAYEVWVDAGNTGTEAQYLTSLKGVEGKQGPGVNVVATIEQDEFDLIVADGEADIGDAYIVGVFLYVFNGTDWVKSNAMQGPKGQGLNYLGEWPTATPLPLDINYKAGDTYVWQSSLWTLVELPTRKWVDVGVPGPQGKSAYETWKGLPGNTNKTEAEFIASIKGDTGEDGTNGIDGLAGEDGTNGIDGEKGDTGESAYEIWIAAGNTGSEAEFLVALKGEKGDTGDAAVAFTIKAKLTNIDELPVTGIPTEAYYVGRDLYVWIVDDTTPANSAFVNFGSLNGASAYETWLEQSGNAGKTEAEFIASLKGVDGTNGTNGIDGVDGTNGKNLQVLGRKANLAEIQALPDPEDQDAYTADDDGHLYIYVVSAWVDAGKFRGADGTNGTNGVDGVDGLAGEDGKSAYQLAVDAGYVGDEPAWLASLKGVDGKSIVVKSSVATFADLPVGAADQDVYSVVDTNRVYMWIGAAWVLLGSFRGTDGVNGKSTYQTWLDAGNVGTEAQFLASLKGTNGTNGADGNDGTNGTNGTNGRNVQIKGPVANQAALPAGAVEQDAYTTTDTGHLYMWISDAWVDLGQFKGEKGDTGEDGATGAMGQGLNILGEVTLDSELPSPATLNIGDAYFSQESNKLFQVNEAKLYNPGIDITGPQGEEGPEGKVGKDGNSIAIQGSYDTEAQLLAADPPQTAGHGYIVGSDLYLPAAPAVSPKWYNAGPIRGPEGPEGQRGKQGLKGTIGNTGERGSLWLTLSAGMDTPTPDYGRDGDWAVSASFETFYKAPGTGWTPIGRLVAGDVNSPSGGLGKVVRMGTEWVPLPVDEVPTLVEGEVYARQLKAGSDPAVGEWVKITFPANFPETTADGKDYVRTRATGQSTGTWKELVFPVTISDLSVKGTEQYVRVFLTADSAPKWQAITLPAAGIAEAPTTAGKTYLRSGATTAWVEFTGISAPADTKKYLRTNSAWVAFDSYDVAMAVSSVGPNFTFNMATTQLIEVDNSGATAKVVNFTNNPGLGRTTTLVLLVNGAAGAFSFQSAGVAGNFVWNGGVAPTFQTGINVITFLVIGAATAAAVRFIGSAGAQTTL